MQIPKEQILDFLRSRGEDDKANQADGELPDQVDTRAARRPAAEVRHRPAGADRQARRRRDRGQARPLKGGGAHR
jgi:hypothetical protein